MADETRLDPAISIIIINYNCSAQILRCINSIKAHTSLTHEIVVVDNASRSDDLSSLESTSDIALVRSSRNLGFGRACNLGFAHSHGRHVVFLNPDTILDQSVFEGLVRHLETNPNVGLAAPRLIQENGTFQDSWNVPETIWWEIAKTHYLQGFWYRHILKRFLKTYGTDSPWPVGSVVGACWAMSREMFAALGGFDPEFFMNGEDSELCDRIREYGKAIHLLPWIQLHHHEGLVQKSDWSRYMKHRFDAFRIYIEKRYYGWQLILARLLWWEAVLIRTAFGFLLLRGTHRTRIAGYIAAARRFRKGYPSVDGSMVEALPSPITDRTDSK